MDARKKNQLPISAVDIAVDETLSSTQAPSEPGATARESFKDSQRYLIEGEFARGGLGRVLRARDARLDRSVAVKELLKSTGVLRDRFQREVSITARLQHPSIVPVYDAGEWNNGEPYYVMKLLSDGRTLKNAVQEADGVNGRLALLPNVIAVADAIAYAHSLEIVHRDLKPSNIVVGAFGETVVIDWGLAKDLSRPTPADDLAGAPYRNASLDLTSVGSVIGTPQYMAPEQARGEATGKRADVYSLGALLYYVLVGAPPFAGLAQAEVVERLRASTPAELALEGIPDDVAAIVRKAMACDSADRYASAAELVDDLRRFHTGQLVRAHEYSSTTLIWRWMRRHRVPVAVISFSLVVLVSMALVSVRRIQRARDLADQQRAVALGKRNELILLQAKSSLEHDPTTTLAWLKTYPSDGANWPAAQMLAAEASSLGVARYVLPTGPISTSEFLPDGKTVIVGSHDGHVTQWDIERGLAVASVPVQANAVTVSPDGSQIAIGGFAGEVSLWEAATQRLRSLGSQHASISGLLFSPDGKRLASIAHGDLRLWNTTDGSFRALGAHDRPVNRMLFSGDGTTLFYVDGAGQLFRVAISDGEVRLLGSQHGQINDLSLSTDGALLATAGDDGTIGIWSLLGKEHRLLAAGSTVTRIEFLPKSHQLVSISADHASLWDADKGLVRRFSTQSEKITRFAVAADGAFATANDRGDVRLWNPATGESSSLLGGRTAIETLLFSRDGALLLSAGMDEHARIWRRALLPRQSSWVRTFDGPMCHVVFSPDGTLVAGEGNRTIRLCSVATGECRALVGHEGLIYGISFSPDGAHLASAGWDGTARVWDVESGTARVFKTTGSIVRKALFSPDGTRLIAASSDGIIEVWPISGGEPVLLRGHVGNISALAVSPIGTEVVSGGDDGTVRVWDWATGTGRVLGSHDKPVGIAAFSRDGSLLATGSRDGVIKVWDPRRGTTRELRGHHDLISALRFSADGRSLLSSSWDNTARMWEVETGQSESMVGHANRVRSAVLSSDEHTVATAADDHTVRVWDRKTGAVEVLQGPGGPVRAVDFSEDGTALAAASDDRTVRVWRRVSPSVPRHPDALSSWMGSKTDAKVP